MWMQVRYGAEQGSAIQNAVAKRAEEIVLTDDPYDRQGARHADALYELVVEGAGNEASATIVVHADAAVLTDEEARALAETESGAQLCSEAVRQPSGAWGSACWGAYPAWQSERWSPTSSCGGRGNLRPERAESLLMLPSSNGRRSGTGRACTLVCFTCCR